VLKGDLGEQADKQAGDSTGEQLLCTVMNNPDIASTSKKRRAQARSTQLAKRQRGCELDPQLEDGREEIKRHIVDGFKDNYIRRAELPPSVTTRGKHFIRLLKNSKESVSIILNSQAAFDIFFDSLQIESHLASTPRPTIDSDPWAHEFLYQEVRKTLDLDGCFTRGLNDGSRGE